MGVKNIYLVIITLFLANCSSSKIKNIDAEKIVYSPQLNDEAPTSFIADAMKLKEFYLFPDATVKKIESILAAKKATVEALHDIKNTICSSSTPRFTPKISLQLVMPKPPKGMPLDMAAKMYQTILYKNRQHLKEHYFDLASKRIHPILEGKERWDNNYSNYEDVQKTATFNPAFSSYKKFVLDKDDGDKANWNGSSYNVPNDLLIPYLYTEDKKEIASLFNTIEHVPDSQGVVKMDISDPLYGPDHFISILFPKSKSGLLVSRVMPAIKVSWTVKDGSLEGPKTEFTVDGRVAEDFFEISPSVWQIKDHADKGNVRVLNRVWFDDLAFLRDSYVFVLPEALARKLSNPSVDDDNTAPSEELGYQDIGNGYRFSADLALKNQSAAWTKFFATQTTVKVAPMANGDSMIEISLLLDMFCSYSKSSLELQALH